jgi:hypothetical protein
LFRGTSLDDDTVAIKTNLRHDKNRSMDKQHILDEIRRTAKANDGIALGRLRFFSETGIKENDWVKYWARWSEAVLEAGLSPNQKKEAYEEKDVLEPLAIFIRELGRFPVDRDLRLRARRGDGFPASTTIRRLGTKTEIATKIIAHLSGQEEYADVVTACEQLTKTVTDELPAQSDSGMILNGFVYLMKSGRNYKIGATNDIGRRGREIGIELPDPANTIHVIRTDDPFGIEAYWHKRFAAKLKNGEWFELDRADVSAFRRRKFM